MTITAGTELGPYEIIAPLGAGGMGEVWRGVDRRLGRSVAIKILPVEFSNNAHLKLRLDREAKAISRLNHPNICTLYDVGHAAGTDYLVMELIEGESLADRLARGPLPLADVIRYGAEIASALEKAHRNGIVHRDLKPGNVMLTKSGAKLLDFGLAAHAAAVVPAADLETEQKPLTAEGVIVGTFRYMSPEQLEGQNVDHRTDIFSLGALLYEMATGRRAFDGRSRTSVIAAIVASDPPPLSQVQPLAPAALDRLIRTCLAKDPDARIQSAHDVALQLRWIEHDAAVERPRRRVPWFPWTLAALLAIGLAAALAMKPRNVAPVAPIRFTLPPPAGMAVDGIPAISPDGRSIVFPAVSVGSPRMLWIRSLDSIEAKPLNGTEDVMYAFWSRDGRSLGFFARGKLSRLDLGDGRIRTLYEPVEILPGGASWGRDDVILFSPRAEGQLYRIPAQGGDAERVSTGKGIEIWPWFLPDGDKFLFYLSEPGRRGIYAGALSSPERKLIISLPQNEITPSRITYSSGHVVYNRNNELWAQRLDASTLETSGTPLKIHDDIEYYEPAHAAFSASEAGTLVLKPTGPAVVSELTFVGRDGAEEKATAPVAAYADVRLSPDQRRIAVTRSDRDVAVWMIDAARGAATRITFERWAGMPVWMHDSRGVAYAAAVDRPPDVLLWREGASTRLTTSMLQHFPTGVTPDGSVVIAEVYDPETDMDLYSIPVTPPHTPVPLVRTKFRERDGIVSPDGRWLAYSSTDAGQPQIYVMPLRDTGARVQISTGSGISPRWSADGRNLYYVDRAAKTIMEVSIAVEGGELRPSLPAPIVPYTLEHYDVASDGRFLIRKEKLNPDSPPLTVITNWTSAFE